MVGPTAVGKTEFGIHLAEQLGTEIIGADSMQIYRQMDIGTGKPGPEERARVFHHLVDCVDPADHYSVGRYRKEADAAIAALHGAGKIPLVVGGTGLYIRALTDGLFEGPAADTVLRKHLKETALREGSGSLHLRLKEVDPAAANRIHPNDERRLIRALEVYTLTGTAITELQEQERKGRQARYRPVLFGLTTSRNRLYSRIESRVDTMIEKGLVEEVEGLLNRGIREDAVSMQGLGYKELVPHIRKERTLERSVALLKQETRHFAKRQMTWFKADPRIKWIDVASSGTREGTIDELVRGCLDALGNS